MIGVWGRIDDCLDILEASDLADGITSMVCGSLIGSGICLDNSGLAADSVTLD